MTWSAGEYSVCWDSDRDASENCSVFLMMGASSGTSLLLFGVLGLGVTGSAEASEVSLLLLV